MKNTTEILRKCKITRKYKGYFYLSEAVKIVHEHYDEQIQITKDIYPVIARKYKTTCTCVEHNIRTVIERCWDNEKEYMEEIIGCRICKCPSNMEFIDCLVCYIWMDELEL